MKIISSVLFSERREKTRLLNKDGEAADDSDSEDSQMSKEPKKKDGFIKKNLKRMLAFSMAGQQFTNLGGVIQKRVNEDYQGGGLDMQMPGNSAANSNVKMKGKKGPKAKKMKKIKLRGKR